MRTAAPCDIVVVMNVYLVIPTVRSLDFLSSWGNEFAGCHLIIVEDHAGKQIKAPGSGFKSVEHFSWYDIRNDFGENEWIFPRQNAGIRSYGFWKAYQKGADVIITLDDDCYPAEPGFVQKHLDNLASRAPDAWFPTFPHPGYMYTRGYPYGVRNKHRTVVSHGLWSNKMDMDAKTQLRIGDVNIPAYPPLRQFVPVGYYFPMSSMNLAFTRDVTPLMYFPLMGKDPQGKSWGFDRYDDIWAGVIAKRILDHLNLAVTNGSPFVEHRKASNPLKNLQKEKSGMRVNETLWRDINTLRLNEHSVLDAYKKLMVSAPLPKKEYFLKLREAAKIWSGLFS